MKRIAVNTVLQKYRKKKVYNLTNEEQIEEEAEIEIEDSNIPLNYLLKIILQHSIMQQRRLDMPA